MRSSRTSRWKEKAYVFFSGVKKPNRSVRLFLRTLIWLFAAAILALLLTAQKSPSSEVNPSPDPWRTTIQLIGDYVEQDI